MKSIKLGGWLAVVAFILAVAAVPSRADDIIDFNVLAGSGQTGTIKFAGGTTPLVGVNIAINSIVCDGPGAQCTGTPYAVTGLSGTGYGKLNFVTGNFSGFDSSDWFFDDGSGQGSISITGCIKTTTICGTLMTGTWDGTQVTETSSVFRLNGGSFTDTKDPALLALFGLSSFGSPFAGTSNLAFSDFAKHNPPHAFSSKTVLYGGIANDVPAVPEPASVALMGTGLLGIAGMVRRKLFS
jgi:hypothetical protein